MWRCSWGLHGRDVGVSCVLRRCVTVVMLVDRVTFSCVGADVVAVVGAIVGVAVGAAGIAAVG
jgi:hypothetical protein